MRLRPDFAEAHNNLGVLLRELGKLAEATASLQEAVRLRPDFAEAHFQLGLAFGKQDKNEEAAASNREAVRLKPDYAEAHFNLGVALERQGKLAVALALEEADAGKVGKRDTKRIGGRWPFLLSYPFGEARLICTCFCWRRFDDGRGSFCGWFLVRCAFA